ncbi:MAG: S8 family serine peptidase [Actinomycetota bacterium]|nr:S8 family serine peptidase [Actinomycetota bacterium]
MSAFARVLCAAAALTCVAAPSATPASAPATRQVVVSYRSAEQLAALERSGARIVRTLSALRSAVVETSRPLAGPQPVLRRALIVDEPALAETYLPGIAWEWQWDAARVGEVPDWILRAASSVTVAVIDSGADLRAPDLADKSPATWSVLGRSRRVRDRLGHGTFVSSLAAGSVGNGVGISGFGGDAKLLVVQAIDADGYITDVDEAAAIVYAVKHGAKIVNLSIGGLETSAIERRAIHWAFRHGALIVAAAGNEHDEGNPVEYPAALLQPVGSRGRGGIGLAVGATSMDGNRAYFSNTGSYVSLAAPGYNVFAAESGDSDWPRADLPWQSPGYYGWASGTSFAAPEVAGVAALVWGANPRLTPRQVARVLKQSARGTTWNPELGWGRLDAAAAVELALQTRGGALRNVSRLGHEPRPSHSSPPS